MTSVAVKVPPIGLGTYVSRTLRSVEDAVVTAVSLGYRFIDCAWGYDNEGEVGTALQQLFASGIVARRDVVVGSKLHSCHHAAELVEPFFRESLERLQLAYLDFYLIHWPMGEAYVPRADMPAHQFPTPRDADGHVRWSDVHFLETWRELERLKDAGLVRHLGVSNFSIAQLEQLRVEGRHRVEVVQAECHLRLQQAELRAYCREHNIVFIGYCPIFRARPDLYSEPLLLAIAARLAVTPVQVALRYLIQLGVCVIPKSTNAERLAANYNVFHFTLTAADMQQLASLEDGTRLCPSRGNELHPLYPF